MSGGRSASFRAPKLWSLVGGPNCRAGVVDCARPEYPPSPEPSVEGVGLAPCVSAGGSEAARMFAVDVCGLLVLAGSLSDLVGEPSSSKKFSSKSSSS